MQERCRQLTIYNLLQCPRSRTGESSKKPAAPKPDSVRQALEAECANLAVPQCRQCTGIRLIPLVFLLLAFVMPHLGVIAAKDAAAITQANFAELFFCLSSYSWSLECLAPKWRRRVSFTPSLLSSAPDWHFTRKGRLRGYSVQSRILPWEIHREKMVKAASIDDLSSLVIDELYHIVQYEKRTG
jgi:hypothetical protein